MLPIFKWSSSLLQPGQSQVRAAQQILDKAKVAGTQKPPIRTCARRMSDRSSATGTHYRGPRRLTKAINRGSPRKESNIGSTLINIMTADGSSNAFSSH